MPSHILLVEDNSAEAALVTHLLARASPGPHQLTHVETVREAAEHLRTRPADCVLLDLTLPDATGPASVRAVREASQTVPIVVLGAEVVAVLRREQFAEPYLVERDLLGLPLALPTRL
ncbi:hypothetical protein BH23ACT9_BH23ACT9_08340 [soil metagenome]